jgi:hypothetical protein
MKNSIIVRVVPLAKMRYATLGDWRRDRLGRLIIEVAEGHPAGFKAAIAVAIHEITEVLLCEERGISDAVVTKWDKAHPKANEPGEIRGAPYFKEHAAASAVEREFVKRVGLGDFDAYNKGWDYVWEKDHG